MNGPIPFDFQPRTRLLFGPETVGQLGELARELGTSRALVVSDPGVVSAGHTERGVQSLASASVESLCFDKLHENPSTDDVDAGLAVAKEFSPELIVGLGGGSSMDCAKGINFLYSNGGRMQDYWGVGKAQQEMLPMIAVPTTAGTGSETQSFALISDSQSHVKMACGDKKAACKVAILDPTLTLTQPPRITALTGIDALAHALETFVTKKRNPISLAFSRESWRLLSTNLGKVLDDPSDLDARGGMLLGASFAGLAIENSMLGATHALANPLTAAYGLTHGQAIGIMLPHVIRFNGEQFGNWYEELISSAGGPNGYPTREQGPAGLADFVTQLVAKAGLPGCLADCGVEESRLPEDAAQQWTGTFNPRPVGQSELNQLYSVAY